MLYLVFYPCQLKGKIALTAALCIYLICVLLFLDIFEQNNIKWILSFVQADRDPVREQLLQSSEGQVQRGPVPGARGNDH